MRDGLGSTYQRIQATYRGRLGVEVGIFVAVDHLRRTGRLSVEQEQLYFDIDDWFKEHLPEPSFYADGNSIGAVTWFKARLPEAMTLRIARLRGILTAHGVAHEHVWSENPGTLCYEDDFQIGVIPHKRREPTPMPAGATLGPTTAGSKRHLARQTHDAAHADVQGAEVTTHAESPLPVAAVLEQLGHTFATFDARTQDSGHISYGVLGADGRRWFVKTAGDGADSPGGTPRHARIEVLRRAAAIHEEIDHPALVPLEAVVEASDGVLVVHDWFAGELLRSPAEKRDDPDEAYARFRALPLPQIAAALDTLIDVHAALERAGWIAGDFYDGCLMYDFDGREIKLIDLEYYHRGPFVNEVGRLPGSLRFMAPEEYAKGARIDARTTVYNLGRMLEIFLINQHPHPELQTVTSRATADDPGRRQATVAALQAEWRSAVDKVRSVGLGGCR